MKNTARAAKKLGVGVVNGFTGSSIWHLIYAFPPTPKSMIDAGFKLLAERWNPILDVFEECGVKFALEVHPTEIAFDIYSAERALEALDHREEFGFNFDPSHLIWQGVDPVEFIRAFPDRIYHVHMKDAIVTLNGRTGILASHLTFGDPRRGWDFRSVGPRRRAVRGDHPRAERRRLRRARCRSNGKTPAWTAKPVPREACQFCKNVDFAPSGRRLTRRLRGDASGLSRVGVGWHAQQRSEWAWVRHAHHEVDSVLAGHPAPSFFRACHAAHTSTHASVRHFGMDASLRNNTTQLQGSQYDGQHLSTRHADGVLPPARRQYPRDRRHLETLADVRTSKTANDHRPRHNTGMRLG